MFRQNWENYTLPKICWATQQACSDMSVNEQIGSEYFFD